MLTADQQALSTRFASTLNPFDDVPWSEGYEGCPMLGGCCAQFVVSSERRYPGGDHHLHLGRVIAFASGSGEPLVFFGNRYRRLGTQE